MMVVGLFVLPGAQVSVGGAHRYWSMLNGFAACLADMAYYKVCFILLSSLSLKKLLSSMRKCVQLSELGVRVSVLGPVTGLYLVVPAVLGVLLLDEPLTLQKVIGLVS